MTTRIRTAIPAALLIVLPALGCATAATQPGTASSQAPDGARLFEMTCSGCHNLRPPRQFSSEKWPVIVNHMRTRADLTRAEAEAVAEYLRQLRG